MVFSIGVLGIIVTVALLSSLIVVLVVGICPSNGGQKMRGQQAAVKWGDGGQKRTARIPLPNTTPKSAHSAETAQQELANYTIKPIPTHGPIQPTFKKLRKGTNFDNAGFENDLDMAVKDLTAENNMNLGIAPPPLRVDSIMSLPPPPAPESHVDSLPPPPLEELPFIPPPPPEDSGSRSFTPSLQDAILSPSSTKPKGNPDVTLHELELDMGGKPKEESEIEEEYIAGLKHRKKSIFRPTKQYLLGKGANLEDIKTLQRPKSNKNNSGGNIGAKSDIDENL